MGDPTSSGVNDTSAPAPPVGGAAHNPLVTGSAGVAAGGVFSFALLTEMGVKDQLANAHNSFAFICAITVLCLLVLACLLVGYITLTRGVDRKAPPLFWAGLIVFSLVGVVGLTAIVIDYFRDPGVDVVAYLEPNSDLSALPGDPPLSLSAYLNDAAGKPLVTDSSKALSVHFDNKSLLKVSIGHLDDLKNELRSIHDLRDQQQGGQTMRALFLQACVFVPPTNGLHQQCQAFQSTFQQ
jgi:hypothetical protein